MLYKKLLLFFGILININLSAQIKIKGRVYSIENSPIVSATITLKNNKAKILSFAISDPKGNFQMEVNKEFIIDSAIIEAKHLSFSAWTGNLSNKNINNFNIEMQEIPLELQEIVVNKPRIRSKKDTIIYDVNSFTRKEDRTIGDVLSRMPGMEVKESGEVIFNGNKVSRLYIEGKDLLEDKYGIGTKTIAHNIIDNVEVLEHHIKERVLQGKTYSNTTVLNLKVKDKAKISTSGIAKIGLGDPKLFDAELSTIIFNKKVKMLNFLQGNNTGRDISSDYIGYTWTKFNNTADPIADRLISNNDNNIPPIHKSLYSFNKSGILSSNILIDLKDSIELRLIANSIIDSDNRKYFSEQQVFTSNDTISYREEQKIKNYMSGIAFKGALEVNKSNMYLFNKILFIADKNNDKSSLELTKSSVNQNLDHKIVGFENTFQYIPILKNKNIIDIQWYTHYSARLERLEVQDEEQGKDIIINKTQNIDIPQFKNKLSVSHLFAKGFIKHSYQVVFDYEKQLFETQLINSIPDFTSNSDVNNLLWKKSETELNIKLETKQNRWESSLRVPFIYRAISYSDRENNFSNKDLNFIVNPELQFKYFLSALDFFSFHYTFQNKVGNISDLHRGNLLTNYRTIKSNMSALPSRNIQSAVIKYNFQRTLKMLFGNIGLLYRQTSSDFTISTIINEEVSVNTLVQNNNSIREFIPNIYISKYVNFLKGTIKLNTSVNNRFQDIIINEKKVPLYSQSISINPSFDIQLRKNISLSYNLDQEVTTSFLRQPNLKKYDNISINKLMRTRQNVSATIIPYENFICKISLNHYRNKSKEISNNYLFPNISVRYLTKKRIGDFELEINNIGNIQEYKNYNITANMYSIYSYELRGRMGILRYIYTF